VDPKGPVGAMAPQTCDEDFLFAKTADFRRKWSASHVLLMEKGVQLQGGKAP